MVQGGYYLKGFAKHGPLHNPHAYGYFGPIAYHGTKQGGHVTPGGIIYKGDAFPPAFRGAFIGGNLLSNAVYWHELKPGRLDVRRPARRHPDRCPRPLVPADRPPDRARRGRLRRRLVRQAGRPPRPARHLGSHQRPDLPRRLRRTPQGSPVRPGESIERRAGRPAEPAPTTGSPSRPGDSWPSAATRPIVPRLKSLLTDDRDETIALRDLWALYVSGGLDDGTALELLGHPTPAVRRWTIRLLGDDHRMNSELEPSSSVSPASEPDASVRSQLASSCQRWRSRDALPILERLVRHDEDASDTHIPNLIWWAFERQLRNDRPAVVTLLCSRMHHQAPLFASSSSARPVCWLPMAQPTTSPWLHASRSGADERRSAAPIVTGLDLGMDGRRLQQAPPALAASLDRLWKSSASAPGIALIRLCARMGRPAGDRGAH